MTKHPHNKLEFAALKSAGSEPDISTICHAFDNQHNIRDLFGKSVIICEVEPAESDYGTESYATMIIDDGAGQSVYLLGGNAGRQALSFNWRGMLPVRRVLDSVQVNGHELLYWGKGRWAEMEVVCPECDAVLVSDVKSGGYGALYCPVCEEES
jgi:hypothetical protein